MIVRPPDDLHGNPGRSDCPVGLHGRIIIQDAVPKGRAQRPHISLISRKIREPLDIPELFILGSQPQFIRAARDDGNRCRRTEDFRSDDGNGAELHDGRRFKCIHDSRCKEDQTLNALRIRLRISRHDDASHGSPDQTEPFSGNQRLGEFVQMLNKEVRIVHGVRPV